MLTACSTAMAATAGVVQAAAERRSEMLIHKTASRMMSARGSRMPVVVQGEFSYASVFARRMLIFLFSDANCGAAFNSAIDDTALGVANGCGQTNPSNSVSPPNTRPQCS